MAKRFQPHLASYPSQLARCVGHRKAILVRNLLFLKMIGWRSKATNLIALQNNLEEDPLVLTSPYLTAGGRFLVADALRPAVRSPPAPNSIGTITTSCENREEFLDGVHSSTRCVLSCVAFSYWFGWVLGVCDCPRQRWPSWLSWSGAPWRGPDIGACRISSKFKQGTGKRNRSITILH